MLINGQLFIYDPIYETMYKSYQTLDKPTFEMEGKTALASVINTIDLIQSDRKG